MKLFIAALALTTAIALPAMAETVGDPNQDNQTSNAIQNDQDNMQKPALGAKAKASSTVGAAAADKNNLEPKPAGKINKDELDAGGTGGNGGK
jgi:hypothetical protein